MVKNSQLHRSDFNNLAILSFKIICNSPKSADLILGEVIDLCERKSPRFKRHLFLKAVVERLRKVDAVPSGSEFIAEYLDTEAVEKAQAENERKVAKSSVSIGL